MSNIDTRMFLLSAQINNTDAVRDQLTDPDIRVNIRINDADENGDTALMYAVQNNNIELVRLLLENGADVNIENEQAETALHYAAEQQVNLQILELLLNRGADPNSKDFMGNTPLHISIQNHNLPLCQLLLQNGADPAVQNGEGYGSIFVSLLESQPQILRELLGAGVNPNVISENDQLTPLLYLISYLPNTNITLQLCEILLQNGADPNLTRDSYPIILASTRGYCEIVDLLLRNNADINVQDSRGNTCLHLSTRRNFPECVEVILKHNKQIIKKKDINGNTALHLAASLIHIEILEILLREYPLTYPEPRNNFDRTPLSCAVYSIPFITEIDYTHIKMLISEGSDVNVILHVRENGNNIQRTLLEILLKQFQESFETYDNYDEIFDVSQEIEIFRMFLDRINDINEANYLHLVADLPPIISIELCKLLIEKGADVNKINSRGKTPLHAFVNSGDIECMRLLLDNGADINSKDNSGMTPLMSAIYEEDDIDLITFLLKSGADPNATDNEGNTALFYIMELSENTKQIIRILYEFKADIFHENNEKLNFKDYLIKKRFTEDESEIFRIIFNDLEANELLQRQQVVALTQSEDFDSEVVRQISSSLPPFSSAEEVDDEPSVESTGGTKRRKTKKNKSTKKKTKRKSTKKKLRKKTKKRKTKRNPLK